MHLKQTFGADAVWVEYPRSSRGDCEMNLNKLTLLFFATLMLSGCAAQSQSFVHQPYGCSSISDTTPLFTDEEWCASSAEGEEFCFDEPLELTVTYTLWNCSINLDDVNGDPVRHPLTAKTIRDDGDHDLESVAATYRLCSKLGEEPVLTGESFRGVGIRVDAAGCTAD